MIGVSVGDGVGVGEYVTPETSILNPPQILVGVNELVGVCVGVLVGVGDGSITQLNILSKSKESQLIVGVGVGVGH
jgi:hypothetical protein